MKHNLSILALLVPLLACAHAQVTMGGALTMDGGLHVQGNPNISITTSSLANGTVGVPYSQIVSTVNGKGAISFSLAQGALPVGLSLNTSTGAITGTPTTGGSYSFVIRADATGPPARFATQSYTVTIGCTPLVINTASLPGGVVGSAYSSQMQTSGGITPITWTLSSGTLPNGLSLSSGGLISGIPNTVQVVSPVIQAQDSCFPVPQTISQSFTIGVVSPVIITTTSPLPQAVEGNLYSATLAAAGGTPPYTWTLASGVLPAGLSLSSAGVVSGTPTLAGASSVAVKVTDSAANVTTKTFSLTVACTPLAVSTTSLPKGIPDTPYSAQLMSIGGTGAVTWSVSNGSLPAGLSLSPSGLISGTPTQNGTFAVGFQVQDSCLPTPQTTSTMLTLTILTPVTITTTSPLPNGIQGQPYSVQLSASGGTPPYTWSGSASPGLTISTAGIVSGTPTTSGTGTVAAQVQDSGGLTATASLQLTITCPALSITSAGPLPTATVGQAYNFQFASSGGVTPLSWNGLSVPPGLGISSSGLFGGVPTAAGMFNPSISVHDSCFPTVQTASGFFAITVVNQLAITTASPLPAGTEGQSYSAQMSASGAIAPYTWSITGGGLPTSLTLSAGGLISGTPTAAGTFISTIRVQDAGAVHTATGSFSITVSCVPLSITTGATLQTGTQNVAYSQQLQASGGTGALTWTLLSGTLPAGVTLSSGGVLSGTPTNTGTFTPTIQVTDSCNPTPQALSKTFTIVINAAVAPLTIISTSPLPAATEGQAYSFQMQASGGTPAYTWAVTAGALPSGLSLSSGGSITGTPTAAGTATATIRVTDSVAANTSSSFTITVSCVPLSMVSTSPLPTGTQGSSYSSQLSSSGGTGTKTWSVTGGALPSGLTLSSAGLLSGTPTASGTFSVTIQVKDSCLPTNQTATRVFSLVVNSLPAIITTTPLPNASELQSYSVQMSATAGAAPYSWTLISGTLPAGIALSSSGVISGTPTTAGTVSPTIQVKDANNLTASGVFSLTVICNPLAISTTSPVASGTQNSAYSQQLQSTGGTGSVTWAVTAGALPAGITLSNIGLLSGTPSVSGGFSFTIAATDSCAPTPQSVSRAFSLTISPFIPPLSITSTSPLPAGTQGVAYNANMTANGGVPPYTWTIASGSLPAGLVLSGGGAITGQPTTIGTSTAVIRVTDSAATAVTGSFIISISCVPLVISSTSPLPPGTVSTAYSAQLQSQGGTGALTWSLSSGSFPTGVSISSGGLISGTPSASGAFSPTIGLHDSCSTPQATTKQFSLNIAALLTIVTTSPLPAAVPGQAYSVTLTAAGGTPPYTWALTSGSLPTGLSLNASTGAISGTPTSLGFVQVNAATPQVSSSSVPVAFLSNQTSGNTNIVSVGWNDVTSTIASLTDTRGNTYIQAGSTVTGTGIRQAIYYAKNISAGANTVTVVFNQAASFVDIRILEYSGLDTSSPLDVTSGSFGTSAAASSGAATTTSANEVIFGAGTTANLFSGPGSGFTKRIITQDGDIAEDQVVASILSTSATAPLGASANWVMQMAAFKAVGGLGSSTFTIQVTDSAAGTSSRVFSMTQPPHTVTVAWTASPTAGATYNVKRSTVSGGPYATLQAGVAALNFLDQTVQPATTYFYVVSASASGVESANSNQATAVIP